MVLFMPRKTKSVIIHDLVTHGEGSTISEGVTLASLDHRGHKDLTKVCLTVGCVLTCFLSMSFQGNPSFYVSN